MTDRASGVAESTRAFFSFPEVTDPRRHRDYNAWHQLDHLPENLALPGVLHGERWVRTPACREVSVDADDALSAAHYVAMYWFREPADASVEEWVALGAATEQQGRRPELAWTERRLTGFFRPVHGAVTPAAGVSVGALPWRPERGILLEVHRVEQPVAADATVLTHDGVIGSWTFLDGSGSLRITLHYCQADPIVIAAEVVDGADPAGLTTLLRTPLLTITPWEWDWFDR